MLRDMSVNSRLWRLATSQSLDFILVVCCQHKSRTLRNSLLSISQVTLPGGGGVSTSGGVVTGEVIGLEL